MADNELRLEWLDPGELAENPLNWRRHTREQRAALEDVIDEVGWAGVLLYNEATGRLIDGHLRRDVAEKRGEPVPVLVGSWSEEQERLILATLDPIAAMAEANAEALDELLQSLTTDSDAVAELLAELALEAEEPYGDTSTDRDGQGVSSTWDQVKGAQHIAVILGDVETHLPGEVIEMLVAVLDKEFQEHGAPIYETLEQIVVMGVRAFENRNH